jgi:D-arabinose 1-dehydrogenase-like Zn-dependent alcohol dehydrogenase
MVETYSLADADKAYERMIESEARFRSAIEP